MTQYPAHTTTIPIREASGRWREPTLDEILSDPIVEAVMRADSVDRNVLEAMLHSIAQERQGSRRDFSTLWSMIIRTTHCSNSI